jgi:glyoxylase-like metal-dependent hydrolase (beta-lactamase superfamily II)
MADDIPFDKKLDLQPGEVESVMPGVRRILCNNPSPFTFKGTVSYIVGCGRVAIVDPGPDDPAHSAALLKAVRGETVTHIFVTHTHRDHSPGVPAIKAATGAQVLAEGPHRAARPLHVGEAPRLDAANDTDFAPDRRLADGELVTGEGWTIEAVATPGHTANHMAYAFKEANVLFSGDHVMAWSTPVVAPPDGSMGDYMASLQKLAKRSEPVYFPGMGRRCVTRRVLSPPTSCTAKRARLRSSTVWQRAKAIFLCWLLRSTQISIHGSSRPPGCRCWRIWRIWWRAGWRPTAQPPLWAAIASLRSA